MSKPQVYFVLGGPGAGKGTQCEYITSEFDFDHLSAGDLLRAERANPASQYGELISNFIKDGKIVPVEITVNLLLNAMKASKKSNFLVDGFPRNEDNLSGWKKVVGDSANVVGCFFFDCPEEVMEKRLLKRGESSGRTDDNIESIRKRFRTYQEDTMPIINHFMDLNKCWTINSDRQVDDIRAEVRSILLSTGAQPYTPLAKAAKQVDRFAHDAADKLDKVAHQAADQLEKVRHQAADQLATLPPGVQAALGVTFVSVLAYVVVRSLKN